MRVGSRDTPHITIKWPKTVTIPASFGPAAEKLRQHEVSQTVAVLKSDDTVVAAAQRRFGNLREPAQRVTQQDDLVQTGIAEQQFRIVLAADVIHRGGAAQC